MEYLWIRGNLGLAGLIAVMFLLIFLTIGNELFPILGIALWEIAKDIFRVFRWAILTIGDYCSNKIETASSKYKNWLSGDKDHKRKSDLTLPH